MSDGLIAMAEHGQSVCITPFTLMGAMSPVTLAGALAQQNAEALFGVTLTQLVRPGAPVLYCRAGDTPATYIVIYFYTPLTPKE